MPESTVTAKGQITLPAALRRELGLEPGAKVGFERQPDGSYLVVPRTGSVRDLKGAVRTDIVLTLDEMETFLGPTE